ncbi:MAG: MerR family transcriptional regulator [Anaerolineales bacterium]|nr:MerR family transcriptional regulator [Anaerolineales bacterium]
MFKIGEFSRFSRVSVKMLRHYDELGLLKPAHVDPFTNYRYYTADQLPRLHRILALRDLGFLLEQIGTMLDGALSTEQLRGMLRLRRSEIEQRLQEESAKLVQVENRLAQLEQVEASPPYDVVVRPVEAEMMAAIRQKINPDLPDVGLLFEELEAYVARYKARAPRPPLMIYHDEAYSETGEDIEVMVPIQKPVETNGRIHIHELPGAQMACVVHTGRYDTLPNAWQALMGWIDAHPYKIVGPTRELFLRFGANQDNYELPPAYIAHSAAEFVTEIQIPVEEI